MTVKGRRIFNRRPVCFFAFFLAAGILVAEAFYAIPHLYRLIPLLLAVVVTAGFALKGKLRRAVYLPLAFLIGFLSCTGAADVYDSRLVEDCSGTFTARVSSDIIVRDGMAEFYVEDLVVDGVVTDGECEVRVPSDVPDFGAGDIVVLKGGLTASRHEAFDTFFAADALGGTYHSLRAESAEFLAAGEPDAILKVQLAVAKLFYENTDADTSAVARALVIGDQRSIDDLYYDSIQASGLAHVLSVSGLHITALSTALYFLLGKLRVNKKAALVIVLAISLVYVALCDFVPPAVRSLVMTAVFNFASAFGLKKDSLSSLAAAASIILVFSPFSVMHVGFLLSVFSIFGILMFAEPFKRTLMKGVDRVAPPRAEETAAGLHGVAAIQAGDIPEDPLARLVAEKQAEQAAEERGGRKGIPRLKRKGSKPSASPRESVPRRALSYAAESVSVSVAANLTSMPIAAYFFGKIQTLFILSNIVILPYTVFIYLVLMIITPFALITGLHGIVGVMDYVMLPFSAFVRAVGSISFASVPFAVSVTGVVCTLSAEVVLSRYLFLKRMERAVAVIALAVLFLIVASVAVAV